MTSNDLHKQKIFQLWLYAYQTKAKNPGNTVAATNPLFDLLMTSNDGHFRSLDGQTLDSLLLRYFLGSYLLFDMHKAIVKTFLFWRSFQVIRGRWRSLESQTLDSLLLLYSWSSQFLIDMHKAIVERFLFLEVIQVIRGRKRSLEGQTLDLLLPLYSLSSQLSFDMHNAIFEIFSICGGHKRSLEVIKIQFDFILEISITNKACGQKIGRFEPKMTPPPYIKCAIFKIPFG